MLTYSWIKRTEFGSSPPRERLGFKYPRKIVFRDELPKTISGKIQRNKL